LIRFFSLFEAKTGYGRLDTDKSFVAFTLEFMQELESKT